MAKKRSTVREATSAVASELEQTAIHQVPAVRGHDYLQILIERLRAGRVVLCAGAALGVGSPTFAGMVERLLEKLAQRPGADIQLAVAEARGLVSAYPLSVCGFVRRRLGADFAAALSDAVPPSSDKPLAEAINCAAKLPFRAVLTTALDDSLVGACTSANPSVRVYHAEEAEEVRRDGRGRYLLRLLGGIEKPDSILFSESDLRRVLADESFRSLIGDLYSKRSFLFIGFDPSDPDFGIVVDRVLVSASRPVGPSFGGEPQHFALFTGVPRVVQEEIEAAYGIHALPTEQFPDALTLLRALCDTLGEHPGEILPDDDDLEGWLRVLQQEPSRSDAIEKLAALEQRLEVAGDADRLIELWVGRTEVETTGTGRAHCLRQVAKLFETKKGQMDEAFHSLLAAFREAPDSVPLDELERLAGISGLWVELLTVLREFMPQLPAASRPELWLRIAHLYGTKLNHLEYALASLGEAQKLDIFEPATRRKLLELRCDLNRRAERWKDLAEALGQLAAELADTERDRKVQLYLEQGDLYESRLADGVSAIAAFKKARAADGASRDAFDALEHSLRRHAQFADLVTLLDDKAALCDKDGDSAGAALARREAAQLCSDHQGDRKRAAERWEAVRAVDPTDLEALRALEKLYAHEGSDFEKYLNVLSTLCEVVPSEKERLGLYRRLYAEYEDVPGQQSRAEACLQKILQIDPTAEDAYRGLERLYQKERRFAELVETYHQHMNHLDSRGEAGKVDLFLALARVHEVEIPGGDSAILRREAHLAIKAYLYVLDLKPEHVGALEALARLYQVTEQYLDAVRTLEKRARLIDDKVQKAALYYETGRLCEKHQLDLKTTEEFYVRAMELDPQHVQAISALAGLYRGQRDYLRAAKLYIEAEEHTQNRLDKPRYLVEAARQYLLCEEPLRARAMFEQALKLDPEHMEAAAGLLDIHWQEQRFDEALPLLEMLTRKEENAQVQRERLCQLGQAAAALGAREKALKAYQRAVDLDSSNLTALRGLIPLLVQTGLYVDAQKHCENLLLASAGTLGRAERADVLSTLGHCEQRLDHFDAARAALREALEIDPYHQTSLRTLLKDPALTPTEGVRLRRALFKALLTLEATGATLTLNTGATLSTPNDTNDERLRLLIEIGDILWEPLGQPLEALSAYREGLALKPDSHLLLHKCLEVCTQQKRWPEAMDVLDTLIGNEKNAKMRARYRLTAALIARHELSDIERASTLILAALDDEPTLERALEALEDIALTLDDPHRRLLFCRRKIKALGPEAEDSPKQRAERLRLWTEISMLCIQRLGDVETGATAYAVTVALDGQNLDRRRQMAGIYAEMGGDALDKAIAEHYTILSRNKSELTSYRALKELYLRTLQREKAAAVAYALYLLQQGNAADLQLVDEMKARPLRPATRSISKELWRLLSHPDEDPRLASLFQILCDVSMASQAKSYKELGLSPKDRTDLDANTFYGKALRYGFEVLDAPMPEVYPRSEDSELIDRPYRIVIAMDKEVPRGTAPMPVICALLGKALLSPRRPEREVTYEIGRMAALLRPERMLRTLYASAAQLGLIIDAALALSGEEFFGNAKVMETAQGLARALPPAALAQVRRLGTALRESGSKGEAAALAWLGYSDLTAVRAGLVLAGDLETVALQLATDPPGITPLSPKQRLLETIHFTVTEEYFTIRQYLGFNTF